MKNRKAKQLIKNTLASIHFLSETIYYTEQEVEGAIKAQNKGKSKSLSYKKAIRFGMVCPFTGTVNKYWIIR